MEDNDKKKILYLITKSNFGGAQRYVFDLATHLDQEKFDVAVILGGTGQLFTELKKKKVRTIALQSLTRNISFVKEIQSAWQLFKILRAEKPDILHINSSKAGGLGSLIGRLTGVPRIIFTAHGWAFNENRPWWQKIIIKKLHWLTVVLSHTTIVVSETTKRQMDWPFVQNKMVIIHNGRTAQNLYSRDFARACLTRYLPEIRIHQNDFWSVTIGELHAVKQHDVTIRAFGEIVKRHPTVRHIIIGDGEEQGKLERLIVDLNLEDNVFLAGHVPEASHFLPAFDLFVLSSRSEGLGYVIIEACIAGLPIIASDVGGIPEIITHHRDGLLVSSNDIARIAQYYVNLLENPELRQKLSHNALLRAQDFTLEKMLLRTVISYT